MFFLIPYGTPLLSLHFWHSGTYFSFNLRIVIVTKGSTHLNFAILESLFPQMVSRLPSLNFHCQPTFIHNGCMIVSAQNIPSLEHWVIIIRIPSCFIFNYFLFIRFKILAIKYYVILGKFLCLESDWSSIYLRNSEDYKVYIYIYIL